MQKHKTTIITLTTDFGLSDEYVGVVKGVIYAKTSAARIVDLTHAIPPYDVERAAYLIASAYLYFPAGTIHLVVVDPGVGGSRDIILVQTEKHLFLAPDNGVLEPIIKSNSTAKAFRVTNSALFLNPPSPTFHGRDIFAPVAAFLAEGAEPKTVGPEVPIAQVTKLPVRQPVIDLTQKRINGAVINIDHFGNIITNIHQTDVEQIPSCPKGGSYSLSLKGKSFQPLGRSYQDVPAGNPLILFNSRNYLEIAVNQGNAARMFKIQPGDPVLLTKE